MMEGWGSCLSDLTTFISFHLRLASVRRATRQAVIQRTVTEHGPPWWMSWTYVRA